MYENIVWILCFGKSGSSIRAEFPRLDDSFSKSDKHSFRAKLPVVGWRDAVMLLEAADEVAFVGESPAIRQLDELESWRTFMVWAAGTKSALRRWPCRMEKFAANRGKSKHSVSPLLVVTPVMLHQ